ncbi:MAG: helix-turn-helix transcriptional regulator [Acidimicrobiia bacterium]
MEALDRLLSVQELARYLDVPVATIYAWRYRGEGPPGFRVGRHLRFRQSDVEQWIKHQLKNSTRRSG